MAGFVKGSKEHIAYSVRRMRDIGRVHRLTNEGYSFEDIIIKTGAQLPEHNCRSRS